MSFCLQTHAFVPHAYKSRDHASSNLNFRNDSLAPCRIHDQPVLSTNSVISTAEQSPQEAGQATHRMQVIILQRRCETHLRNTILSILINLTLRMAGLTRAGQFRPHRPSLSSRPLQLPQAGLGCLTPMTPLRWHVHSLRAFRFRPEVPRARWEL